MSAWSHWLWIRRPVDEGTEAQDPPPKILTFILKKPLTPSFLPPFLLSFFSNYSVSIEQGAHLTLLFSQWETLFWHSSNPWLLFLHHCSLKREVQIFVVEKLWTISILFVINSLFWSWFVCFALESLPQLIGLALFYLCHGCVCIESCLDMGGIMILKTLILFLFYLGQNNHGLHQTWRKRTEDCTGPFSSMLPKTRGQDNRAW